MAAMWNDTHQSNLIQYALVQFPIEMDPYLVFRFDEFNQYDNNSYEIIFGMLSSIEKRLDLLNYETYALVNLCAMIAAKWFAEIAVRIETF